MHQSVQIFKLSSYVKHSLFVLFNILLIATNSTYAASNTPASNTIVTTIKPLFSLVSHLTEGIDEPILLMKQPQSPHHYNMRPSERQLLANAQMIIWIGPQMESYLTKIIKQQDDTTMIVSAMQAPNLTLLNKRTAHEHHSHSSDKHQETYHQPPSSQAMQNIDSHIWLSTNNATAISKHITQQLIALNPKSTNQYKYNLQQLLDKIEETRNFIALQLKPFTKQQTPFLAYHDAFQYFEGENNLNYIDAISLSDDAGISLKHLQEIKTRIVEDNIQCLVYQAPKPAILNTLTRKTTIRTTELDPLATTAKEDKNAWFELMLQLSQGFSACLSPSHAKISTLK